MPIKPSAPDDPNLDPDLDAEAPKERTSELGFDNALDLSGSQRLLSRAKHLENQLSEPARALLWSMRQLSERRFCGAIPLNNSGQSEKLKFDLMVPECSC